MVLGNNLSNLTWIELDCGNM